ncbi:MAG: hypothetical protein KDN05_20135 [Verrucomicrobiae bacterium]|nr:hypothetical protein [Verrucomicrobiae bacterium]
MRKSLIATILAAFVSIQAPGLRAEIFGGVDFPQGVASFADRVISYSPGIPGQLSANFLDPAQALGAPNYQPGPELGSTCLGVGGNIILEFTNNRLTGSDDTTPDLHIFEVGTDVEDTFVEISMDGVTWVDLGKVSGSTSSIDIDSFGFTSADVFRFVRLTDDPAEGQTTGNSAGADIDAVGAISTSTIADEPQLTIRHVGNPVYTDTISSQGPVAWWRLNESSGTAAANSGTLGATADGTYGSVVMLNQPGLRSDSRDTSVGFNIASIENRVVIPAFSMPTDAITVSFLVQGGDNGLDFVLGYGVSGSTNEFAIGNNSGDFRTIINGSITDHAGIVVLDGTVHHVAVTWTQATGLLEIFVDGGFSANAIVTAGTPLTTGGVLALCQDLDSMTPPNYGFEASQTLLGTLDEVAIFDRVLLPGEISAQSTAALNPPPATGAGEVFLEFESALGTTYTIEDSTTLLPAGWSDRFSDVAGTGGEMRFVVPVVAPREFFRLLSTVD